jgi:hypothetical protein
MGELKPYDAVFLAVAMGLFLTRPRWWWLASLAPAAALVAHWMPLGRFATPAAAIAACLLVPRYAPVALVLAIPIYQDPLDVLRAALIWLAVSALMEGLEDRLADEILSSPMRRLSAQLLSVAVLYYTLLPVMFL